MRHGIRGEVFLTGGLCDSPYVREFLSEKLGREIITHPFARYAGALGAALIAGKQSRISGIPTEIRY
jgi:activator of 2-hydroxyglutaryl-CoA dehydratase